MQSLPEIKGLQSLKTMRYVNKGVTHEESHDFLKLYMQEREVVRLRSEEKRLLGRLGVIQNRMKDIGEFNKEKTGHAENGKQKTNGHATEADFKAMSIGY